MATKFFRVLSGTHTDENNKRYGTGDVVETNFDLESMFVNKFERVTEAEAFAKTKKKKKDVSVPVKPKREEEETPDFERGSPSVHPDSDFGVDVSEKFDSVTVGLVVFRSEDGYTVVDLDEPTKALNDSPLKNVASVRKFVEKNAKS